MKPKKRLLNAAARVALGNLAYRKFVCLDLREAEGAAKEAFIDVLTAGFAKVTPEEMETLAKFKATKWLSTFYMPSTHHRAGEPVEHTLPNGRVVVKSKFEKVRWYGEPFRMLDNAKIFGRFSDMRVAAARDLDTQRSDCASQIQLWSEGRNVPTDSNVRLDWSSYDGQFTLSVPGITEFCQPNKPALIEALFKWLDANRARAATEWGLWRSMTSFVIQAKTFEEVVEFWPEALELEGELYPVAPAPSTALVTLNADSRAALCRHMRGRGVQSAACAAA